MTRPATAADLTTCPVPPADIVSATVTGRTLRVILRGGGIYLATLPA